MNWSDDQIEQLITVYRLNPFLYNQSAGDYHNRTKRRIFLEGVAKEFDTSGRLWLDHVEWRFSTQCVW